MERLQVTERHTFFMKYYLAPMEGLTTYNFRTNWNRCYGGMDKYFTPFISNRHMNSRERNDVLPEHNVGMYTVPQILTNKAEEFLSLAEQLAGYGYHEVNLNLGCPSGTVTAKGKGAGFLAKPEELERFLTEIFDALSGEVKISVKTRIGKEDPEEFPALLELFNKYPMEELIIHPRVQKDFYKNTPRMDDFALAMQKINPDKTILCYNGDITNANSFKALTDRFPDIDEIMIGRGLFANPALIAELKGISMDKAELCERLKNWHDEILSGYLSIFSGEKDAIFRMKEIWAYMHGLFPDSEKLWKKIKKSQTLTDYKSIVRMAFDAF